MTEARGTIEGVFRQIYLILAPLRGHLSPGGARAFFADIGIPLTEAQANSLAGALSGLVNNLTQMLEAGNDLDAAINANDFAAIVTRGVTALSKLGAALSSFSGIGPAVGALGIPGVTPAVLNALSDRIFAFLVADNLGHLTGTNELLEFVGVLEREDKNVGSSDPLQPFHTINTLHLDRIAGVLSNPAAALKDRYDWGSPSFDGKKLLAMLDKLLAQLGLPSLFDDTAATPVLDLINLELLPKTDVNPKGLLIRLKADTHKGSIEGVTGDWQLSASADFGAPSGTEILVQPEGVTLTPPEATNVSGQVRITLSTERTDPAPPIVLIGLPGGSRIVVRKVSVFAGIRLAWTGSKAVGGLEIGGELADGKAIIDGGAADGFMRSILPTLKPENPFTIGFGYSGAEGLHFDGSSAIEIQLASHINLGPVEIRALNIGFGIAGSEFPTRVTVDLKASLGPLTALIQGMGVRFDIKLVSNNSGNLGPLDIRPGFQPPKGAGLSLDAGIIQGGGFLLFDSDRQEYAGALELVFAGFLGLHAIGLISTRMPDGSSGFSLLIIITADFGPGIQLGFGFTLLAVGGLIGLNRAMLFQPLMDGIRTNAIEGIMFPRNVVANAMRIISDLRAIFPPQQGTFLIGPMAKLGWGEPTLISLSLGIIIEIPPGDIAILGILKLALPAEEIAVLVIQVNFAGALEFDKKRFYFFASLFDSHVLFITIEGEMGVLMAFGDDANFVLSVGGFHPQFIPPPLPFPSPRRIQVDIINESFARIRCDGYFAVTSNSCQFGSHSEFFFGFSALSVEGHSGFDALLQFSPFHFSVSISTSFSVKVFGLGVYGVGIDLTLEGPTPWHARGTASLSFFFFDVDIGIEFTWGDSRNTMLPPVALMPVLAGELAKQSNWRAILPAGSNLLVSLRKLDPGESVLVLHPVGTLNVSQRAIPLDLTLDKAGNQAPNDANRFALTVSSPGLSVVRTLQEQFAAAQFKNLSDAAKLSQPAYSPMDGGLELSAKGAAYASGTAITCNVRYDLTIIDTKLRRFSRKFFVLAGSLFTHFLSGSSVAYSVFSAHNRAQTQPFAEKIAVNPESFAVALTSNNQIYHPEAGAFTSQAVATDYLERAVAKDPTLAGSIHVIPQFEVAA